MRRNTLQDSVGTDAGPVSALVEAVQIAELSSSAADATGAPGAPRKAGFLAVLRNANFRNLWLGQVVSQVGDYFVFLATNVVVSGFFSDAQAITLAVAGMLIANSLPRLLFGLLSGVFVDRWDRRATMLVSDVARMLLTLGFIPAVLTHNLWLMYAIGFLMSSVGTLFMPAKGALVPNMVESHQLMTANSLSQTTMTLSILLGPAIAGITLKLAGPGNEWVAFVADSASFLISAISIWLIRLPREKRIVAQLENNEQTGSAFRRVWRELIVGVQALFLNRTMATLALVFAITMLGIGAVNVLWTVFLKLQFGYDGPELAWRFSLLDIIFAAGILATTVLVGNYLSHIAPKYFIVVSLIGVSVPFIAFGMLTNYWSMAIATAALGLFFGPVETGANTLMQTAVPNDKLGRVGGGMSTITETATVTSMSISGVLGAALGVGTVFAIAGLLCALAGVMAWVLLPSAASTKES